MLRFIPVFLFLPLLLLFTVGATQAIGIYGDIPVQFKFTKGCTGDCTYTPSGLKAGVVLPSNIGIGVGNLLDRCQLRHHKIRIPGFILPVADSHREHHHRHWWWQGRPRHQQRRERRVGQCHPVLDFGRLPDHSPFRSARRVSQGGFLDPRRRAYFGIQREHDLGWSNV